MAKSVSMHMGHVKGQGRAIAELFLVTLVAGTAMCLVAQLGIT